MPNSDIPFVAVIGGFWRLDPANTVATKAAGQAIGSELAKAGFGFVVVDFSHEESLELHLVSGYAAALKDGAGVIRVRYAELQRGQVDFGA